MSCDFIYWTKEGRFETNQFDEIPWDELHSPDDNTPALIWEDGQKEFFFDGKHHRLSGPAIIWDNGQKLFYLNGKNYFLENWLKNHPNQDISFQTKMKLQYT